MGKLALIKKDVEETTESADLLLCVECGQMKLKTQYVLTALFLIRITHLNIKSLTSCHYYESKNR